jgi:hypothetical protein
MVWMVSARIGRPPGASEGWSERDLAEQAFARGLTPFEVAKLLGIPAGVAERYGRRMDALAGVLPVFVVGSPEQPTNIRRLTRNVTRKSA